MAGSSFRHSAGFGKRMEYFLIGQMLMEGLGEHGTMWILSSEEFLSECVTNKHGKNAGKHSIWFNGNRRDPKTHEKREYCKKQFEKYICTDFSRFH